MEKPTGRAPLHLFNQTYQSGMIRDHRACAVPAAVSVRQLGHEENLMM
jgi:hypothetical protein